MELSELDEIKNNFKTHCQQVGITIADPLHGGAFVNYHLERAFVAGRNQADKEQKKVFKELAVVLQECREFIKR